MSDKERWGRVNALVNAALDRPEDERDAWLKEHCGDDETLYDEVRSLLAYDGENTGHLKNAIGALAGELGEASEDALAGRRIGNYRIIRKLAKGGMGIVFAGERADDQYQQRVAIKMVSWLSLDDTLVERFQLERQILAGLEHPNIARLIDGGTTDDGVPYFVMEYIDGRPVVDVAAELSVERRLALFLKICDAVQYAHSKLVVHRDIKPSNILVTHDGTPKLLDFGIAKFLDEEAGNELTRADARMMTPEYASPEQLLGKAVTIATDVYGLGLMLYRLLAGELPFDVGTRTSPEIRELVCNTEPAAPSELAARRGRHSIASSLKGDLDNIVLTALRKEPERRYETVRDLANDIRRHLERRPVLARAPSAPYRIGRFISRNRVGVAASAAALVAATGMTAFYTVQLQQERDYAQTERATAEAATDFMVDLFSINDPDKAAARDITAREVLDAGAKKLDAGLEEQPRVRARLLNTIGRVYERLGDYDNAQRFLEEGVSLRRSVVEPLDEDLILALENLAWLYYRREDWDRAEQYASEAMSKWEAKVGRDDPALADVLNLLGTIRYWKDDIDGALARYHRALALVQGDEEEIVKDRLTTMNNLAITYDTIGRSEEAIRFYEESLDTRIPLYGDEHPRVGTAHANLGNAYLGVKRFADAREHGLRALAIDRRHLGDTHADVAFDLNLLSNAELGLDNIEAAADYAKKSAETWAATVGREHSRYASAVDQLAEIYWVNGRYKEALEPANEVLEIMLKTNGPDHSYTANAYYTQANIRYGLRQLDEAQQFAQKASRIREEKLGRQNSEFWNTELVLARIDRERGNFALAEDRLERLIGDIEGSSSPDARQVRTARAMLEEVRSGD